MTTGTSCRRSPHPARWRIRAEGEQVALDLTDGGQSYALSLQPDGVTYAAEGLPVAVPLYLKATARPDYGLAFSGTGSVSDPEPDDPPVELALQTDTGPWRRFCARVRA